MPAGLAMRYVELIADRPLVWGLFLVYLGVTSWLAWLGQPAWLAWAAQPGRGSEPSRPQPGRTSQNELT